ncbi:uncharacterized protein ATNIH1004_010729 [Aspergillus tanneri]|uniref:GST N-terminal domain-containing protein n=1 Tax=Aspergillus tanneri TaxID=1220188 RepID=A0A5M9M8G4_9EURO|nr:uncharacterized protein ATNIH1004_010729 [Aspergillus tanneri]KAA8641790.1 hypothetical protein ATNIH1004_010729 [Aspergillus tanneri]
MLQSRPKPPSSPAIIRITRIGALRRNCGLVQAQDTGFIKLNRRPGTTGLPYEQVTFPVLDVKTPEYVAINPNGRLPALYDPNIDLTLWESGTIVEYLMQRYYKEHPLSFPQGSNKASITQRWLFFQTSGQTPYFGQALWFKKFHPERIPSALAR